MWKGPKPNATDEQAYYTDAQLAQSVVDIARKVAPRGALFVDIGVGAGAIYKRLPAPKVGVELMTLTPKLKGVQYGIDVLKWTPPKTWKGKHIVVVCNPPFAHQVPILNRCCGWECASLHVVWIAGLIVRHWDVEDRIDGRLHLANEWLTPPELSTFATSCVPGVRSVEWRSAACPTSNTAGGGACFCITSMGWSSRTPRRTRPNRPNRPTTRRVRRT